MRDSDYGRHSTHAPLRCRSKVCIDGYVGAGEDARSVSRVVVGARDTLYRTLSTRRPIPVKKTGLRPGLELFVDAPWTAVIRAPAATPSGLLRAPWNFYSHCARRASVRGSVWYNCANCADAAMRVVIFPVSVPYYAVLCPVSLRCPAPSRTSFSLRFDGHLSGHWG